MAGTAREVAQKRLTRYVLVAAAAILSVALPIILLSGSTTVTSRVLEILFPAAALVVVYVCASLFAAIFVHELGHAIAGLLGGFEFRSMLVGPLELRRNTGHFSFGIVPHPKAAGFVRMVPRSTDRIASRMLMFVAAGPVASVLYTALTWWFLQTVPSPQRGDSLVVVAMHVGALSLFVMGLSVLPGTLLPFRSAVGVATDMRIILTLLRSSRGRERYVALMLLAREVLSNMRPREWSGSLLALATELQDGDPEEIRGRLLSYYHADDLGKEGQARSDLDRAAEVAFALGKKRGVQGDLALLESAFVLLREDGDLAGAESLLERAGPIQEAVAGTRHRVLGASALAKGDREGGLEHLREAEEALLGTQARFGGNIEYDLEVVKGLSG